MHVSNVGAIRKIERALGVQLPQAYKDYLEVAFRKGAYSINELYDHPDEIVAMTCRRRLNPTWPGWRDSFVAVGDDGCGNIVFLNTAETGQSSLLLFSHDPVGIESLGDADSFLLEQASMCEKCPDALSQCDDRHSFAGIFVARKLPPWKALLSPISEDEWIEYIHNDPELTVGFKETVENPFSGGFIDWQWENWATWLHDRRTAIQFSDGAVFCEEIGPDVLAKMMQIGKGLRAEVVTIP